MERIFRERWTFSAIYLHQRYHQNHAQGVDDLSFGAFDNTLTGKTLFRRKTVVVGVRHPFLIGVFSSVGSFALKMSQLTRIALNRSLVASRPMTNLWAQQVNLERLSIYIFLPSRFFDMETMESLGI